MIKVKKSETNIYIIHILHSLKSRKQYVISTGQINKF